MNIFREFGAEVDAAIGALQAEGVLPGGLELGNITLEPPRDPSHGDLSTNAALILAKPAAKPPRVIAEALAARLAALDSVTAAEVAGPGFVNLRLSADFWRRQIGVILAAGSDYGRADLGAGQAINVEYVSANPTGPLHMGHCRGSVVGDALAALLEFTGYRVTREYYINDAGSQIDTLARSAHLRYRAALGEDIGEIPEGLYPGDYLVPVGEALAAKFADAYVHAPESEWLGLFKREAVAAMMDLVRADLALLGVRHDVFFSEQSLHDDGRIGETIADFERQGLIYEGVLEPPKGKTPEDWEPRPQRLFKATDFGDDTDRPLQKSDGAFTYFAADIAYHRDKLARGFATLIDVWGADHGGYVKRMQAAVNALSGGAATLDVKLCQMVRLFRGGEPVKMSKRAGTFVTMADVVREVGRDVVRLMMLIRKPDAQLDFDFLKVVEQSRDNPVFYIQYAHARACSAQRKAQALFADADFSDAAIAAAADLGLLDQPDELALIGQMAQWPRLVEAAALAHEPHRVAFYLNDLAAAFHACWNKGNDDPGLRFVVDDNEALTRARLALILALRQVIGGGLRLLGVEPVEEMR
ncbi:MAG: arginine--tRNA ligase [Sphingomonadales bacterium]